MSDVVPVAVECRFNGKLMKTYDGMGYGETLDPSAPPPDVQFINEAKDALTNDGLARPPYVGFQFKVRRG
jgi:hypothetical protein